MRSVVRMGLMLVVVTVGGGWGHPPRPLGRPPAELGRATFSFAGGRLRIEACADDVIRVAFARDEAFFSGPSLMAAP